MPSLVHQAWTDNNFSSPSTVTQFGPFTSAAGISRLLRIRCVFSTSQPGIDLGPNATVRDQIAWGVQSGSPGYTPQVLPSQLGGFNFYWSELLGGDTVASAAWTPPTNDFGWADTRVATREWRGQLPIGENQDFYVTSGIVSLSSATYAACTTLEIDYSD